MTEYKIAKPGGNHGFMEVSKMKVLIVGGVAGGATAAARIRRLDENAEIII